MASNGEEESHVSVVVPSSCYPIKLKFIDITYSVKIRVPSERKGDSGGGFFRWILRRTAERNVAVEERTVLNGITGMASPGELLAVIGPSGSGKSTLLNILAGHLQGRHGGTVLANGRGVARSTLRRVGFVPQDDVLYPHLTVRETLVAYAMLRLPRTVPAAEKVRAAEAAMAELGLTKCQHTIVGNAFVRGVSGGERKRVSIGGEMVGEPSVLLLDEPTSGLDATAAHRVMSLLSGMATRGRRTVVAVVHQPSSQVFQMFDMVLLLSGEGNCLYFGRGSEAMDYFGLIGFAPRFPVNPADFLLDLANGVVQVEYQSEAEKANMKQSLISSYNQVIAPKVKATIEAGFAEDAIAVGSHRSIKKDSKDYASNSWFTQFRILLQRSLKERRHESFNSLRVFQVIAAAILAGLMWWHSNIHDVRDRQGLLFFIAIFWGVFPSFNAVFTFPQEQAIFVKERSSGMYSLSSYFMARLVGDLPMELLLPTIFLVITYWMGGLRHDPTSFVLTLIVLLGYVLVAEGLGLAVGALIMDTKRASTIITITMLAFLLIAGFYVQKVPLCMMWLKYASLTFYCYRLLIGIQYRGKEMAYLLGSHHGSIGAETAGGELEVSVSNTVCVVVLVGMFVGYRLLAYMALRRIKA